MKKGTIRRVEYSPLRRSRRRQIGNQRSDADLRGELDAGGEAEIALMDHLQVIVGKSYAAESRRAQERPAKPRVRQIAPQQGGNQNGDADEQAAHGGGSGFLLMIFGAILANKLADLKFAQPVE